MQNENSTNLEKLFAAGWQKSVEAGSVRGEMPSVGKTNGVGKFIVFTHNATWKVDRVGKTIKVRRRRLSVFTAFDLLTTPPTLVRRDISLETLRQRGNCAMLPQFYFDELGNLRGLGDELVMAGPRGET